MKICKGCVNPNCESSKKKRKFKYTDSICAECGTELSFVCAKCGKPMSDDSEKLCISCKAEKEQKNAKRIDAAKKAGMKAVPMFVAGVTYVANNADTVAKGVQKTANAVKTVQKVLKK